MISKWVISLRKNPTMHKQLRKELQGNFIYISEAGHILQKVCIFQVKEYLVSQTAKDISIMIAIQPNGNMWVSFFLI